MEDDVQFKDIETYSGGKDDKLTFKLIALLHLKQIGKYASVEFRGGFWEERPHPNPNINDMVRIYIPDTREIYSNAVEYLVDMLYPHFDDEMKKSLAEADAAMKKAYNNKTIIKQENREDTDGKEGKEYDRVFKELDDKLYFRNERVMINRKLFRDLCSFLFRKRYLELGTIED